MPATLSRRIEGLKASSTVAFAGRAKELARQGVNVISMTAGEPDFLPPQHVLDAAREAIDLGLTKYTPSEGTAELREAVAAKFQRENGIAYAPDQVMVSNGGKQVLYNGFLSVLDPGDEVVLVAPYWVSYPAQIELAGGVPVVVRAPAETGFVPDLADVRAAITPRTKVLLVNSPSNPTGAVYPPELVRGFAELAEEHDLWLFTDDLYEHLVYDGEFVTAASYAPERTLLVHGASKGYAMTGWRIGFGAGPKKLVQAMNRLQGQSTSGANAVAQHATVAALTEVEKTAAFQRMTRAAYVERRDVLVEGLNRLGLSTPKPQGAFYVMADSSAIDPDEERAAIRLLDEARVAVVPGTDFLAPGRLRFSYATSLDNVKAALERIGRLIG
ncbi:MAG: pyridoxal phosphate-dependent aminotransferase [Deinococcales bacterium]|mgnify:CR=1 FL=1|nr:pyridoxal phosphate-dependent aminotransferase [Deinococcales bacterium]